MNSNRILNKLIFIFLLQVILLSVCFSQKNTCYEQITLIEFLDSKIENDTSFVKAIYENLNYPVEARAFEIEGKIGILFINHGFGKKAEIIQLNHINILNHEIQKLETEIQGLKFNYRLPFMTRFYVHFEMIPSKYKKQDYEKFPLGLIDGNTFVIMGYQVPEINSH